MNCTSGIISTVNNVRTYSLKALISCALLECNKKDYNGNNFIPSSITSFLIQDQYSYDDLGPSLTSSIFAVDPMDLTSSGLTNLMSFNIRTIRADVLTTLPALSGLSRLTSVSLNMPAVGQIVNFLPSNYFLPVRATLTKLSLSESSITSLNSTIFNGLYLRSLDLRRNPLTSLPIFDKTLLQRLSIDETFITGLNNIDSSSQFRVDAGSYNAPMCPVFGVGNCQIKIKGMNYLNSSGPVLDPVVASLQSQVATLLSRISSLQSQFELLNASIATQCLKPAGTGRRLLAALDPCGTTAVSSFTPVSLTPIIMVLVVTTSFHKFP